ncbi:C-type mannose receptor 2-like [Syngnathus typhle]
MMMTVMMMRALGVLVLALSVRKFGQALVCEAGWKRYGPNCYKKISVTNGWLGAHNNCTMWGAHLTSITSKGEEDFVKTTMGDVPFWIGLSNLECHSTWCHMAVKGPTKKNYTWSDNTLVNYTNWAPNQKESSELESCAYVNQGGLGSNGLWRYGSCESSLPFLCKKTLDGSNKMDDSLDFEPMWTTVCSPGDLVYGQFCYHFAKTLKTWSGARSYCRQWGGDLAYYHTLEEAKWVYAHTRVVEHVPPEKTATRSPWVGLYREKYTAEYVFTDGTRTNRELEGKMVWSKKTPKGKNVHCAQLLATGELLDYNCSNRAPVVCNKAKLRQSSWNATCGWMWVHNPVTDFCYLIRSVQRTWKKARDDCARDGATLLTITDAYEQAFIHGRSKVLPSKLSFWMNANMSFFTNGAKWADGTPFAYARVNAADRNNPDCLTFVGGSGSWKMTSCYYERGYICKRRANMSQPLLLPHDGFVKRDMCMDVTNRITCPEGQVIRVQSVFYGQRSARVCGNYLDKRCEVEGALLYYRNQCKNHRECFIEPMATKGCPDVTKYLQMVYSCEPQECLQRRPHLGITASSFQRNCLPRDALLDGPSCWKPSENPIGSWIMMNLHGVVKVAAIVIQSCPSIALASWSKLGMQHSMDMVSWTNHSQQFVTGGAQLLATPLTARFIRILPLEYSGSFGLRCGVLGCVPNNLISCDATPERVRFNDAPKTVYCSPSCSQPGYTQLEKFSYKMNSSICAAALDAGVILKKMGGVCTLMRALKKVFTVFTQNGLVAQEHDPEKAFTFADGELRCSGPDWTEFAGFCYKPFEEAKTWADAENACKGLGADLVSIHSKAEQQWLKDASYFATGDRWTGLNDLTVGGSFTWSDHRNVTFTDWGPGEPNLIGSNECVAGTDLTGRWKRMSCQTRNPFMCKMPTAFYALGSQADPQSNPKWSDSVFTLTHYAHQYFYVHFENGLRVNDNITITGRVRRTDRFQVSLHMGSTKVALQLNWSMQKKAPEQVVHFKIVIQCGEQAFRMLINEALPLIRPYEMYRPDNITQLHLLGAVLLRVNHLQMELQMKPL